MVYKKEKKGGKTVRKKDGQMKNPLIDEKTGLAWPALGETNSSSSVSIKYMVCLPVYPCPSCSPASNA